MKRTISALALSAAVLVSALAMSATSWAGAPAAPAGNAPAAGPGAPGAGGFGGAGAPGGRGGFGGAGGAGGRGGAGAPGGRGGQGGAPQQLGPVATIPDVVKNPNPPRTPNPLATYTRSGVRNDQRHNAFVEIAKKDETDILFLGDSITDWWQQPGPSTQPASQPAAAPAAAPAPAPGAVAGAPGAPGAGGPGGPGGRGGRGGRGGPGGAQGGAEVFKKYFSDVRVSNFAIAGDTTQGVLWGLKNGEAEGPDVKMKPKAIMIMIGTNNTGGQTTGAEIAEGVGAIVAECRKHWPNAKILLLAIFPRGANAEDGARKKNDEANKIIAKLDDGKNVFFMDLGPKFLKPDGSLIGFRTDNLHPNAEGYEIWGAAVADKLKSWVKGN